MELIRHILMMTFTSKYYTKKNLNSHPYNWKVYLQHTCTHTRKKKFLLPPKKKENNRKKIEFERISHLLNLGENIIHNNEKVYNTQSTSVRTLGEKELSAAKEKNFSQKWKFVTHSKQFFDWKLFTRHSTEEIMLNLCVVTDAQYEWSVTDTYWI